MMLTLALVPPVPGEFFERLFDSASVAPPHDPRVRTDRTYVRVAVLWIRHRPRLDWAQRGCGVVACTRAFQARGDRVRFPPPALGAWRSLVAHPAGGRKGVGSNPTAPTNRSPLSASGADCGTAGQASSLTDIPTASAAVCQSG